MKLVPSASIQLVERVDLVLGNQDQAKARMVRLIRKNLGLTCAFSWASHKIHALHKLNRRRGHQLRMAEEIDRELQIDENPAILYSQGKGGVGTE